MQTTYKKNATQLAALFICNTLYALSTMRPCSTRHVTLSIYVVRDVFFADQIYTNPFRLYTYIYGQKYLTVVNPYHTHISLLACISR